MFFLLKIQNWHDFLKYFCPGIPYPKYCPNMLYAFIVPNEYILEFVIHVNFEQKFIIKMVKKYLRTI